MPWILYETQQLEPHPVLQRFPRGDVAERLYDIRCKIVHTKADARTGELDLLLPFSKEAELLAFDIEIAQFLAQRVLIAASTALK